MKRIFSLIALTATMCAAIVADAAALSETDVNAAAIRWASRRRLGIKLSPQRTATRRYTTQDGNAFYGVRLGSSGTVFVAGEGNHASVLAFTRQPLSRIDEASPLYAIISRDLAARGGAFAAVADGTVETESDIDDLRVMPFVRTKWNQAEAYPAYNLDESVKCYNYYTPTAILTYKFKDGTIYIPEKEYSTPCGCVATAMAQAMRYWQHPSGRSSFSNTITRPVSPADVPCVRNNGTVYYMSMKMTNELVLREQVTYSWNDMIECPLSYVLDEKNNPVWSGDPVTEDQCKAIGGFTYDCGVSVGLEYKPNSTDLYTSDIKNIPFAFTNVFGYASAISRREHDALTVDPSERARAILTNLDAKRPVILLVSGNRGGHAILADGYGFAGVESTPFVHLNMGWSGQCDIWYNLPSINVSSNPENFSGFDTIAGVVYNIAPNDEMVGEIVSGRATDESGSPVLGVEVKAYAADGSLAGSAWTDERGVYSIILPPDAEGYDIFASKGDNVGDAYTGRVAESCDEEVGNSWGNDLSMGLPKVRVGDRLFSGFRHAVEFAQRKGEPLVEVLRPCSLAGDITVSTNLSIVATNAAPRQSTVVCSSYTAPFKVADGARLSLSNIVMSAADVAGIVNVDVASNSTLAVSGLVVVDTVTTADASSFEIAGPLENGIVLKCAVAKSVGNKFGTTFAGGAVYAAYIFNGYDLELAGVADGSDLKWASDIEVPPDAAFVVFDDGSTATGYGSFDAMLAAHAGGSGEIRLRGTCWFRKTGTTLSSDCVLTSENTGRLIAEGGSFTVDSGAKLVVSNIVVTGASPKPLVTLGLRKDSTGRLVLAAGARIARFSNTSRYKYDHGGAVSVNYGSASMLPGSSIDGCSTPVGSFNGGGVYLKAGYASLELAGGKIVNCVASGFGGGVYAGGSATVSVTGASVVSNNVYRTVDADTPSDIYICDVGTTVFSLGGDASGGSIGVYPGKETPSEGDAFMKVTVDAETATNSAAAFFCNAADLAGAVSEDATQLVWKEAPDHSQCEPERAVAIVVYDGDGETNYYENVRIAFENLRGDATMYIATNREVGVANIGDWVISDDIDIVYNVTLCTVEGALDAATVYRCSGKSGLAGSLFVRTGAKLTLSDIAIEPGSEDLAVYAAIAVDGGELVVEDGTVLSGFQISASRAAGAINVYNGGVLRMRGGEIRACTNLYRRSVSDYGVGAGVLVDNATAYFEGGSVVNCTAARYAGVYIGNHGSAYVSGAFTAKDSKAGVAASNFAVQDLSSLVLTGPLAGTVGFTEGVDASTNIFGEVGCELTPEVVASATNFHHDVTGALGAVATNAEGRAVLVWSTSFPDGEDSFEEDGEVYYRVASTPPPPPGYTIHYVGGDGATGSMDDSFCLYGKVYNLRKCTLSKGGARFAGWAWNGRLYDDGILIFNLSDVPGDELDFVAVWVDE